MARGIRKHTRFQVELSTSSAWFARLIEACGHQVVVVDPDRLRAISSSPKNADAHDAEVLATLGKAGLPSTVHQRSEDTDRFRRLFTARHALVRAHASLIRTTRSLLPSEGPDLPSCDGDEFDCRTRRSQRASARRDGCRRLTPPPPRMKTQTVKVTHHLRRTHHPPAPEHTWLISAGVDHFAAAGWVDSGRR